MSAAFALCIRSALKEQKCSAIDQSPDTVILRVHAIGIYPFGIRASVPQKAILTKSFSLPANCVDSLSTVGWYGCRVKAIGAE
jgi:hypothetical protein